MEKRILSDKQKRHRAEYMRQYRKTHHAAMLANEARSRAKRRARKAAAAAEGGGTDARD